MKTYHDLPTPTAEAQKRSTALHLIIEQQIQAHHGKIPFSDFMQLALYHPMHGYYQQPTFAFGQQGDFTTAPELSPLFAQCFARQCQQIFETLKQPTILELGAGSGRFALDMLTKLESLGALPDHYAIFEISAGLRQKQLTLFQEMRPDLLPRITWLTALPTNISGIVIANEVLDALPFACFQIDDKKAYERMVTMNDDDFSWELATPSSAATQAAIEQLQRDYALPDGYQSEVHLPAMALVRQLAEALSEGIILFADYGYGQREYYHPQRSQGSLSCFYQHQLHDQPLLYPGLQDITAHVDFTRVIETAADAGCQLSGFTTQSAFLLANGLLDEAQTIEDTLTETEAFRLHQAIKVLTLPTEMGDRVKIMAISRNAEMPLTGFSMLDRRRDL
tara:strand:- start:1107 stop:2285 length:1179 start_codon:yes stop_codon:yes gene_type:complete